MQKEANMLYKESSGSFEVLLLQLRTFQGLLYLKEGNKSKVLKSK